MHRDPSAPFRARGARLSRRWVLALVLCVAGGAGAGVALAPSLPYTFKVTARIMFQRGRETSTIRPELNLLEPVGGKTWEPHLNELRDFVEMIESPAVVRPTVESLCAEDPSFSYETAGGRGGMIGLITRVLAPVLRDLGMHGQEARVPRSVEAWADSFETDDVWATPIVDLICYTTERAHGVKFLERLIENHKRLHMATYGPAAWYGFVEEQLALMERQFEEAEAAVTRFRLATGIPSVRVEKLNLLRRRFEAEARSSDLQAQVAALEASTAAIEATLADLPQYSVGSSQTTRGTARRELESDLVREEQNLARMMATYPELSAWVSRSGTLRTRTEELLADQPEWLDGASQSTGRAPVFEQLREELAERTARLSAVRAEAEELRGAIGQLTADLARVEAMRAEESFLTVAVDQAQRDLQRARWSARVAEASHRLDEALLTNVKVLQPPEAADWPERVIGYQHRLALVYAGAFVGFLLWAVLFMLRNVLREDLQLGDMPGQARSSA